MTVHDGKDVRVPVPSMLGVARMNVAEAARAAVLARGLGILVKAGHVGGLYIRIEAESRSRWTRFACP